MCIVFVIFVYSLYIGIMREMRKAQRQKDEAWAAEVFDKALCYSQYGSSGWHSVWNTALARAQGREDVLFSLCRRRRKIDCLKENPIVSLSAVSRCTPKYEEEKQNFTEYYNSAVAIGRAHFVNDDAEKICALRLLCERFLPKYMEHFEPAVQRSLSRTTVVRIELMEPPVGKSKP